jgi:hypothetical protein
MKIKTRTGWLPLLGILVLAPVVHAQSLAELAQKEKERRAAKAKDGKPASAAPKVITQEDLDQAKASRPEGEAPAPDPASSEPDLPARNRPGARSPQGLPDDSNERAVLEKSWKTRAEVSRAAVRAAEQAVASAQNTRNALGPVPVPTLDPLDWGKQVGLADTRLAAAKAALQAAQKNLESLEEDARKAGIPPGWIR